MLARSGMITRMKKEKVMLLFIQNLLGMIGGYAPSNKVLHEAYQLKASVDFL